MNNIIPILSAISYQIFIYLFIYLFNFNNNDLYIPLLWGGVLYGFNLVYAGYLNNRYLDINMTLSAIPYIIPAYSLWHGGYLFTSISVASILGTSPLSDALLPFTSTTYNYFPYYFDVTHVTILVFNLLYYIIINYVNIYILLINIILWISPLLFWKFNTYSDWRDAHMIWHIFGSINILISSELWKFNK